jgi:hypothetical protein
MTDPKATQAQRIAGVRWSWVVAAFVVTVALVVAGSELARQVTQLPAANLDYSVVIAEGAQPVTPNGQVAAIARHYLDEQDSESHVPPRVMAVTATLARSASALEACVPAGPVAAAPDRIVWVVQASGDFMNPHDLPWSRSGTPFPGGNLVIDDATGEILGVYPHAPRWQSVEPSDTC